MVFPGTSPLLRIERWPGLLMSDPYGIGCTGSSGQGVRCAAACGGPGRVPTRGPGSYVLPGHRRCFAASDGPGYSCLIPTGSGVRVEGELRSRRSLRGYLRWSGAIAYQRTRELRPPGASPLLRIGRRPGLLMSDPYGIGCAEEGEFRSRAGYLSLFKPLDVHLRRNVLSFKDGFYQPLRSEGC